MERVLALKFKWGGNSNGSVLAGFSSQRYVLWAPTKTKDVAQTSAALLIQNAGLDKRIGAGAPAYEAVLMANNSEFTARNYVDVNQIFHNDTTPRYDAHSVE